ncbi:MAG TPA: acyltransferase [Candidatus Binatia bacterium]|nr:acyltransferase [Candidatus Binatia bacterium]
MTAPGQRIVAIDMLKGAAIVWVMLIHAEALRDRLVMVHVFNHAVPIFVVLFGLNSELWWRRRTWADLGTWYVSRARRLYVPIWAMLVVWWAMALWFQRPLIPLSWKLLVWHAVGDLEFVGTAWFVTLILQLVVLFPFVHFVARRLGLGVTLLLGIAATVLSVAFRMELVAWIGISGMRSFSPRFLGHVAFGMLLAHHLDWLRWRTALLCMALVVPCWTSHAGVLLPALGPYAERLLDLPLTLALLVAMGAFADVTLVARPLAWLGVHSWGLYVGQMLVHNAFGFTMGYRNALARIDSGVYALILLAGSLVLVLAGNALLARVERWRQPSTTGATSQR